MEIYFEKSHTIFVFKIINGDKIKKIEIQSSKSFKIVAEFALPELKIPVGPLLLVIEREEYVIENLLDFIRGNITVEHVRVYQNSERFYIHF